MVRKTITLSVLLLAYMAQAGYKDDIGYTRLESALGASVPDGTNVAVTLSEGGADYMPDTNVAELAGKWVSNVSGLSTGVSAHATIVAQYGFGRATSIAPAMDRANVYQADDWLEDGFLKSLTNSVPVMETNAVQNHSWVGNTDPASASNILHRLDYAVDRDGFTCVGALSNAPGSVPYLLASSYNTITVGRSDGSHSYGLTAINGAGRTKPELVSPGTLTSWAAPIVSSAAVILFGHARDNASLTNAMQPECVKALLLAGCTKQEFSDWDRTHSRPIDEVYGAGELNIYNSYYILDEGEQTPGASAEVPLLGWDYGTAGLSATSQYFFAVGPGKAAIRVSAILTWHREVTDGPGNGFDPLVQPLANLDLRLYSSTGFVTQAMLDWSTSTVDNVEHIYIPHLTPGQYAFEVVSDSNADYGLAWYSETIDIPAFAGVGITNGNTELTVDVTTNYSYVIEAATNLLDPVEWVSISTATPPVSPYSYIDSDGTNYSRRFYRMRLHDTP